MMRFLIVGFGIAVLVAGCGSAGKPVGVRDVKHAADEMLVNGNFADGSANWVLEESGATGRAECVKKGRMAQPPFASGCSQLETKRGVCRFTRRGCESRRAEGT